MAKHRPGKIHFFYTTKFLAKINFPLKKRVNLPKNSSFTKHLQLNCQNCQEIGRNALTKSVKSRENTFLYQNSKQIGLHFIQDFKKNSLPLVVSLYLIPCLARQFHPCPGS